jgi:peroxiredoxin
MNRLLLALSIIAAWSAAGLAKESEFNERLSVGEPAPNFAGLPGIDGQEHALAEYKKAKAVVVVFTSNPCPVAIAYEDRLVALQKEFAKRGVQLVAICSNFEAGNSLDDLKKRATAKKFNFPVLRDDDQSTGRAYGASKTPHVFLLDGDRKIAYMGAIDDNEVPEKITKHYLRDALESVLADKAPETKETRPFGCTLRYKRRPQSRNN